VAQTIARAQQQVYAPAKVGLLIAGLEVPHVHLHVIPIMHGEADLHLDRATTATPELLEAEAAKLRRALEAAGAEGVSG
jgi:diadenosine tetraphosphate (Ap4A) HIT family hydrolase